MPESVRLDEAAVAERLSRIDRLLEQIEGAPGPMTGAAIEAVQALTEVYGEALARVVDGADPGLADHMAGDELVGHLLVLHGIHPEPPERRAARAVDAVRPAVRERGGDVELEGVEEGVARVRLAAKGCGTSSAALEEAVREAVLTLAPELSGVEQAPGGGGRGTTFVPVEALTLRTASVGERT
ncbi:nitrogen fixation protein NifU [Streptomyces hygroscopicus]|uniref:NifU family protein n=1 Tax=Streptomyces hygroscopicus TaxID=1912 RepID=UPI00223FA02C|nr:NifU family protein [Streptomyces hygroscopicus]MCW7945098.1 nitrogen fixation protein NifU [Streptomyces hygroscopicus]